MKNLPKNWITEGTIDFELKKYQLLAYLQASDHSFKSLRLYPPLADLVEHHRLLLELLSGNENVKSLFPKRIKGLDFESGQISYESLVQDDNLIQEINEIAEFARPQIKSKIEEGIEIYESVKGSLKFEPVGILPIYKREGYVFITGQARSELMVFRYKSSLLEYAGDKFRSVSLWLVKEMKRSIGQTLENLKVKLIREFKELPNPATWRIHTNEPIPIQETLLPIGKRLLLAEIVRGES